MPKKQPNRAMMLVNDLINPEYAMLNGSQGDTPDTLSLIYALNQTTSVQLAIKKIFDSWEGKIKKIKMYPVRYMQGEKLEPENLVLILNYEQSNQRILKMFLSKSKATLKFVK